MQRKQEKSLAAYRSRGEFVLRELFAESAALHKIKRGQPVASDELDTLVSEVLVRDPDLRLEDLLQHYPNKSFMLPPKVKIGSFLC